MKARVNILTREEQDVLVLAAPHLCGQQLNNTEIGRRLGVSNSTVKKLLRQACTKLEAHNRVEAMFFALTRGEIRLNEIYSLDELVEIFGVMHPNMFRMIIYLVREEMERGRLLGEDEKINPYNKRQDSILTKSERDVLILVGRGFPNRKIADTLYMSTSTVKTFIYRACTKLGAHNRIDAVLLAVKQGEISIGDMYSLNEFLQAIVPLGLEHLDKIAQMLRQKLSQDTAPLTGS